MERPSQPLTAGVAENPGRKGSWSPDPDGSGWLGEPLSVSLATLNSQMLKPDLTVFLPRESPVSLTKEAARKETPQSGLFYFQRGGPCFGCGLGSHRPFTSTPNSWR